MDPEICHFENNPTLHLQLHGSSQILTSECKEACPLYVKLRITVSWYTDYRYSFSIVTRHGQLPV